MLYNCKLLTNNGTIVNEKIEAEDTEELKKLIKNKNLLLISYRTNILMINIKEIFNQKPLPTKEILYFCNQLYFVFQANVNLINGLFIVKNGTKDKKMKAILEKLHTSVSQGQSLSDSMRSMGNTFPSLLINMISSGESSGNLLQVFEQMYNYYKQQNEVQGKLKQAMIQPTMLIIISLCLMIFFINFILPQLMSSMEIERQDLPLLTQIVLNISDILSNYYICIISSIVILTYTAFRLKKIPKVNYFLHQLLIKIPIIGSLIVTTETYRVSITLHLFLKTGILLIPALEETISIVSNEVARKSISEARHKLLEGANLHDGLSNSKFFDDSFLKFIEIGEETGYLEQVLGQTAGFYNEKLNASIKSMLQLIEPVMTIFIGIFIGIMVLSIAMPIFSMTDYVKL